LPAGGCTGASGSKQKNVYPDAATGRRNAGARDDREGAGGWAPDRRRIPSHARVVAALTAGERRVRGLE
jgi:hypothetical protein